MIAKFQRDTLSDQILQAVDVLNTRYYTIKDTPSANPITFTGNVPFHSLNLYEIDSPDRLDPLGEPVVLFQMDGMRMLMSKRAVPMGYAYRRVDADQVMFIHSGSATLFSEVGALEIRTGHYVFVARGAGYRIVPDGEDFLALMFESEENVSWADSDGQVTKILPTFPFTPPRASDQTEWEERVVAADWQMKAIRDYDPVWSNRVRGDLTPVFAVAAEEVPAHVSQGPNAGRPFILCRNPMFLLEVGKRSDPLPFYHRNCNRTEIQFVHLGGGDRDSELGYRYAPPGSLNVFPVGIEHSVCSRPDPCLCNVWEVKGAVRLNPDLQVNRQRS